MTNAGDAPKKGIEIVWQQGLGVILTSAKNKDLTGSRIDFWQTVLMLIILLLFSHCLLEMPLYI